MKFVKFIGKSAKIVVWLLMALLLLAAAAGILLYSPWSQELARRYIVATMNGGDLRVDIEHLRLKFPLDICLEGVTLEMPGPQTIKARNLHARVAPLPLLGGRACIEDVKLGGFGMMMGAPDSAMYMTIGADTLALDYATITLKNMNIDAGHGMLGRGRVSLTLNPVPAAPDTAKSEPTDMVIRLQSLGVTELAYTMRMLPTIDSLGAVIPVGSVENTVIDLKKQRIGIGAFTGTRLDASYIAPDSATVAATPVLPVPADTAATLPWTVTIDSVGFTQSKALYTTRGIVPAPGMDFGYISVDSLNLGISKFYNREAVVRIPLNVSATERCGVRLAASGLLDIDSTGTALRGFHASTPQGTVLDFDALIGMGDMTTDPSTALMLDAKGDVAAADLRLMFPDFTPYLATLPRNSRMHVVADINGTAGNLRVNDLSMSINGIATLRANGMLGNPFNPDIMDADLNLGGTLFDMNRMKKAFLPSGAGNINIPRTSLKGRVSISGGLTRGRVSGNLTAATTGGDVSLRAKWNGPLTAYDLTLTARDFPVNAFMPESGIGHISADVTVKGHGLDPMSPRTAIHATADITRAEYDGYDYSDVTAVADLADGHADINLTADNKAARATLSASGNLDGETYVWDVELRDLYADLKALGFSPDNATVDGSLNANASITPKTGDISATLNLNSLTYKTPLSTIDVDNLTARLDATDSTTVLTLHNRDLYCRFDSPEAIRTIMQRADSIGTILAEETDERVIDVERLQRALPFFTLDINGGSDNAVARIIGGPKGGIKNLSLNAVNDSTFNLAGLLTGFHTETMRLDTISMDIAQYGPGMLLNARVDNAPGTFDEWAHVKVDGFLAHDKAGITIGQHDIKGREGYFVGLRAALTDSTLTVNVDPFDPTIAYKPWTVNEDNFVKWSFTHKHIDANLHMRGGNSALAIYTNHIQGQDDHQEELVVEITDIEIADWVNINPFSPPMSGQLSARINVSAKDKDINGTGTVSLIDLMYDRQRVGTIGADLNVTTDLSGRIRATADISVDDQRTITLAGALNDSTAGSPLALDFRMIHFPLAAVNPFLPAGTAALRGVLNGSMEITGTGNSPMMNGWLQFDSTAIDFKMANSTYPVSDVRIPVDSNKVTFNNFAISGVNGKPLSLNGTVDINNMASPEIDLSLSAANFQICDSRRAARGADIYGKGFIDLNATVRGNFSFMRVNANLGILAGTNITYVMTDAQAAIQSRSTDELVKFVNFNDTSAVTQADSLVQQSMAMLLQATMNIQSGTTINVDLTADGKNRVQLQPEGTVNMTMLPFADPRLTGRININGGFARYTPPFMGEKLFTFRDNSFVAFNGELMNPTLGIHAVDVVKANVTQTGQNSRLVNFDVALNVTGTLDNMDVAFDLSTDDDMTVANELQAMSPEQRANQAMNMLLYNVYTGPGTTGNGNLSGNALYSFLTSQLNSWAARTIKGVDLSFGVDQYDRTLNGSTSTTTSYSYQVSKSLFNDRFKIVVGGNYSTDANTDENFSQNLIKDISFEYFINDARTMLVRLFRHTGYESILEGEVTRTGVGFVYRKKLTTLRNLFGRRRHRKNADTQALPAATDPTTAEKHTEQ